MRRLRRKYGRAARRRDEWSALSGGYDRSARQVAEAVAALERANDIVHNAVSRAQAAWKPTWARPAKDIAGEAFNYLQKTLTATDTTLATRGIEVAKLPDYHDPSHVNTRAHKMLDRLRDLSAHAHTVKSQLSRALTGDPDQVKAALDRLEGR